jgi:hypothetical protein
MHISSRSVRSSSPPQATSGRVWEPPSIPTHITAPGAILGLTLAFLQTDNRTVANMLRVPRTKVCGGKDCCSCCSQLHPLPSQP